MSIRIPRGKSDGIIEELKKALSRYESDHPGAKIELYRQNSACVRIRIIDRGFAKMSRKERNDYLWKYFDILSDDAQGEISMLLALTPTEAKKDLVNCEFDDPLPSML
jgi:hypothetical protein